MHSQQMASIAPIVIGCIKYLAYGTIFRRAIKSQMGGVLTRHTEWFKAVISLACTQIHKFTIDHWGTVPIGWCLLFLLFRVILLGGAKIMRKKCIAYAKFWTRTLSIFLTGSSCLSSELAGTGFILFYLKPNLHQHWPSPNVCFLISQCAGAG